MKISYKNDEIKSLCKNQYQELNTEKIIKRLGNILGKKIIVLDCKYDYFQRTVKVKNIDDNTIIKITISCSKDDNEFNIKGVINYLVTVDDSSEEDLYIFNTTYLINKYSTDVISYNTYNTKNNIIINLSPYNSDTTKYTLMQNEIECSFLLKNSNENIIFKFLDINELNLSSIYNLLKQENIDYVCNIVINLLDKKTKQKEKIVIEKGNLVLYEKTYLKDNMLINIIYQNGETNVTTTQIINDENNIVSTSIDVTNDIKEIKKLVKYDDKQ